MQSYEENKKRLSELETGLKNSLIAIEETKIELAKFKQREQEQRLLISQQEHRIETLTSQNEILRHAKEASDNRLNEVNADLTKRHQELIILQMEHGRTKAQLELLLNLASVLKITFTINNEEIKNETPNPNHQPVTNPT